MNKKYIIEKVRLDWGKIPVRLTFSYGKVDFFPSLSSGCMPVRK
ncbi:MAG: hypothetical protein V2A65_04655 [Candidatus Omnitrophota bacterium]